MPPASRPVYSVSRLSWFIRQTLEEHPRLQQVRVSGELSNITHHRSGHLYFTLRDTDAQLNCIMFRAAPSWPLQAGDAVIAAGSISVYVPHGRYQLIVTELQPAGAGLLYQKFLELRDRLQAAGLFSPAGKQSLPTYPRSVAVLTSPTGAVLRDVVRTLRRRYPYLKLRLFPVVVQGEGAVPSILRALEQIQAFPDTEVVLLARGGGSLEDLWCFNDERLIHALYACPIPIITGIGHETDTTLADLVADLRAPTPTAAAELLTRDRREMQAELRRYSRQLGQVRTQWFTRLQEGLQRREGRLRELMRLRVAGEHTRLARLAAQLARFDQKAMLRAGYALVLQSGTPLTAPEETEVGSALELIFASAQLRVRVERIEPQNDSPPDDLTDDPS